MAKQFQWREAGGGATLQTDVLTLYVEPAEGGFIYHVSGGWILCYSRRPLPTLAEAQAKCLAAARKRLRDEIKMMDELSAAPPRAGA